MLIPIFCDTILYPNLLKTAVGHIAFRRNNLDTFLRKEVETLYATYPDLILHLC